MKKVLLSAVAILGFTFANAQEEETTTNGGFAQGDLFITGAVGFSSTSMDEDKSSSFTIAPQVGYFLTENIAIGGKIGYTSMKAESGDVDTMDMSGFEVGAMGRYYFTPASQCSLFGQLAVDYSTMENKLADSKVNTFGAGLGLGVNYFIASNWSIEAGIGLLGFESSKEDVDGAEAENTFGLGVEMRQITFGINYKF